MCTLLLAAVLLAGSPLQAAEDVPAGMALYLVVLHDGSMPAPAGKAAASVPEPDVVALGGKVLKSRMNRRLIAIHPEAVPQLEQHARVAYVQRMWDGSESAPADAQAPDRIATMTAPVRIAANTDTPANWESIYGYDPSGNVTSAGSAAHGQESYFYDGVGRLRTASVKGVSETYTYDVFGNMTRTAAGQTGPSISSATNQITGRTYDAIGNQLTDASGRASDFDSLGMIVETQTALGSRRMIYTADDERIAVVHDTGTPADERTTIKIRDFRGKTLTEWNKTKEAVEWVRDYVYAEGRLVAGARQVVQGDSGTRHYHLDHLGSIRRITRGDGVSASEIDYLPFGSELTSATTEYTRPGGYKPLDPAKFTGHERDYLGLANDPNGEIVDYMHARYYDPGVGRFLSIDPLLDMQTTLHAPQTWNRYTYARNNPINFVDPDGRAAQAAVLVVAGGAAIGAAEGALIQIGINALTDQPIMQDVGREAVMGAGIGAVTGGAGVFLKGAYDGFRITRAVRIALNSADNAMRLEGQAAAALGRSVTAFQKVVKAGGRTVGEIDIETSKAIVEVTGGRSPGKLQQVLNLINDKTLNPAGKQIVVYAPNLGKHATKTLQDAGAIVVRTTDELRKVAQ